MPVPMAIHKYYTETSAAQVLRFGAAALRIAMLALICAGAEAA